MSQIHHRFQTSKLPCSFSPMNREEAQETLDIRRSRFFVVLKEYRTDPEAFSIAYERKTPRRISVEAEAAIQRELLREKALIDDPEIPISGYNYSALRDCLRKDGIKVSVNTIIDQAKKLDCHKPRKKRKVHDREVLTASVGELIHHAGSVHRWSGCSQDKWTLVTSIDDYSRKILFADFFPSESTWAHIQAVQALIQAHGVPLRYYVDCLRVFRFVQGRDSFWRKHILETDDVDTQWGKMMQLLGVKVIFALSPQAKGKVERPYRWMQDRIVRTCCLEKIDDVDGARSVLHEELDRYNNHQVHSTTEEIPAIRFDRAIAEGKSLLRPFSIPKPYTSPKDLFCLREQRVVNANRRISLDNYEIQVPKVPRRVTVDIHMIPYFEKKTMELRIWWENKFVRSLTLPLEGFRVHF